LFVTRFEESLDAEYLSHKGIKDTPTTWNTYQFLFVNSYIHYIHNIENHVQRNKRKLTIQSRSERDHSKQLQSPLLPKIASDYSDSVRRIFHLYSRSDKRAELTARRVFKPSVFSKVPCRLKLQPSPWVVTFEKTDACSANRGRFSAKTPCVLSQLAPCATGRFAVGFLGYAATNWARDSDWRAGCCAVHCSAPRLFSNTALDDWQRSEQVYVSK